MRKPKLSSDYERLFASTPVNKQARMVTSLSPDAERPDGGIASPALIKRELEFLRGDAKPPSDGLLSRAPKKKRPKNEGRYGTLMDIIGI